MDALSDYNQIRMALEDEHNVAFITDKGLVQSNTFWFEKQMSHLSIDGQWDLQGLVDQNIEIYVDDMLIKNSKKANCIKDLKEAFNMLRQHQIKLNPSKCAFSITVGKFLKFMSPSEASKQIQRKSKKFLICDIRPPRIKYSNRSNGL